MKLSDLKPTKGSNRPIKRRGCGSGSGHGKTSCRGNKGAGARSGTTRRFGFEGGQMPLIRRVPKRGFNSKFRIDYQIVNLNQLAVFKEGDAVDPVSMSQKGLISRPKGLVKILGGGEIKTGLVVSAHKFSKSAVEKITKAGGKSEVISIVNTCHPEAAKQPKDLKKEILRPPSAASE